jgi:hypothetical protein
VFVDGCFQHCCPRHSTTPAGNRAFWETRVAANRARDRRVNRTPRKIGWQAGSSKSEYRAVEPAQPDNPKSETNTNDRKKQ